MASPSSRPKLRPSAMFIGLFGRIGLRGLIATSTTRAFASCAASLTFSS